jgi:hypothetical protein
MLLRVHYKYNAGKELEELEDIQIYDRTIYNN